MYKFSNHDNKRLFHCFEKVFIVTNIWWLRRIQWNIITWRRSFLLSLKYGRYYWCRLCVCTKNLLRFWYKKFRRISWTGCSKRYIIVSWYIWELSKYVSWNIWVRSCKISLGSRISIANSFKKEKVKLDLLTDIDMLLMVEKSIRGGICHSIYYWYAKANNKYMKDVD